ncbi:MAG: hypothetical protein AB7N76_04460 [Planctomycetota bacterium]
MALSYCEVCGVLIKGGGQELPEGVICDECFESRRVDVPEESEVDVAHPKEKIQFECPYCGAVLRVAVHVGKRTNIRCPKCTETFYAEADGSVKARLEGNTTQVIQQEDLLPELTPSRGQPKAPPQEASSTGTQPMRAVREDQTQPLRNQSATQPLAPLKPSTQRVGPSIAGAGSAPVLPQQPGGAPRTGVLQGGFLGSPSVIRPTSNDAHPGPDLKLLPEEVTIADVQRKTARVADLRASDEGRIDLDTSSLKEKTRRLTRDGLKKELEQKGGRATGRKQQAAEEPAPDEESKSPKKGKTANLGKGARATGKTKASDRLKKSSGRLEKSSGTVKREKRVQAARERADELESESSRRALTLAFGWACVLLPVLVALFLARLADRQAGLVQADKPVGKALHVLGRQSDRAVRSLNELLGGAVPDLPPERPRGGAAPVTTNR